MPTSRRPRISRSAGRTGRVRERGHEIVLTLILAAARLTQLRPPARKRIR